MQRLPILPVMEVVVELILAATPDLERKLPTTILRFCKYLFPWLLPTKEYMSFTCQDVMVTSFNLKLQFICEQ